ncbi:MAG: hypothetical protein NTX03_10865 [Bacteroidetes bacterium]|nr:hypothetical protein [Bacteroidota bacterium]
MRLQEKYKIIGQYIEGNFMFFICETMILLLLLFLIIYIRWRRKQLISAIEVTKYFDNHLNENGNNPPLRKTYQIKKDKKGVQNGINNTSEKTKDIIGRGRDSEKTNVTTNDKNESKNDVTMDKQAKQKVNSTLFLSNDVSVKIIKSVPESENSKPKKIGYKPNNKFLQSEQYSYAAVKMPLEDSLIKLSRKGRSNKKGYTEDGFFRTLKEHFKGKFSVFNDRHIPTKNGRVYEPDFVLSNIKNSKNIYINTEIDEPYEGGKKAPTHCIGKDNIRDDFFTKRGWIVIRFAEIQVHQEPDNCCALIAKVIASIDETFSSELLLQSNPMSVRQWSSSQARKWVGIKYREGYLNIADFENRPNEIAKYIVKESIADQLVEGSISVLDSKDKSEIKKAPNIETKNHSINKVEREEVLSSDDIKHRIHVKDKSNTISARQLVDKFFPKFDVNLSVEIAAYEKGVSREIILKEWDNVAEKGIDMHETIRSFFAGNDYEINTPEIRYFLAFLEDHNSLKPYKFNLNIFDKDLLIEGIIDMIFEKEDGSLHMFDWERSNKIVTPGSIINNNGGNGLKRLSHLKDNEYNKHCLQQNIYKHIIEKYGFKIASMNLLILHQSYKTYIEVRIPDMEREVEYIFENRFKL